MHICRLVKFCLKRYNLYYSSGMCENCKHFYTKDISFEADGDVRVWWFPRVFSQSHFGDRTAGRSNACTLIVLLVAFKCYQSAIKIEQFCNARPPNEKLINALAESIVEGNNIHERLLKAGRLVHINLTVPEAMQAAGANMRCLTEWKSLVYMMDMRDSLHNELTEQLNEWNQRPPERCGSDLFVVLIAENRSVLLIFQKDQGLITLVDSHQHLPYGAVMSQVPQQSLSSLCHWYHNVFLKFYGVSPDCYELSYLYFKRFEYGEMAT